MSLKNYIVTIGHRLAQALTAEPPVIHIPVRAGNLRTLNSTAEPVRVRRIRRIPVQIIE